MKPTIGLLFLVCAIQASAQEKSFIELRDFRRLDFDEKAFVVHRDTDLKIEARGACDRREEVMLSYGWILDSGSRLPVWRMTIENSEREGRAPNRVSREAIRLKPGKYEVYYIVAPRGTRGYDYRGFGDFLDDALGGFKRSRWNRENENWGIVLSAEDSDAVEVVQRSEEKEGIQLINLGDEAFEEEDFTLPEKTILHIYALGEGDSDGMFDYGWIIDANTEELVWKMEFRKTKWAGGADKNRMVSEDVPFDAGDYSVCYVTDESHSPESWNNLPPYDPNHWGITLTPVEKKAAVAGVFQPFRRESKREIVVDMTRISNNRDELERIHLEKSADVHVRCVGELGYDKNFVDYGWIVDSDTRDYVWEMTRYNTKHAGGDPKNRMFSGIVHLERGNYEVGYHTDDSHAYRNWNAAPPYNPEAWGIMLWLAREGTDDSMQGVISVYNEEEDPLILARIVRAGNGAREQRRFRLEEKTHVRIYALGEGSGAEMYDYAWIEDAEGHRIWRMEYDKTEHAGGAKKNRKVSAELDLDPGEYTVYYRTDGSHSYEDWNSDPPTDRIHWGITVRRIE